MGISELGGEWDLIERWGLIKGSDLILVSQLGLEC